MKSESIDRVLEHWELEEWLNHTPNIYRDSEATALFLSILMNQIRPHYKKIEFEPPGMIESIFSPVYGDVQEWVPKWIMPPIERTFKENCKIKTIVRAYFDRRIEVYDNSEKLREICDRMAALTNGNFKIYSKGELKYLY